jgi:hypothetical protein
MLLTSTKLSRVALMRATPEPGEFGRPPTLTKTQRAAVQEQIAAGASVSALAKRYDTRRQTVMRCSYYYASFNPAPRLPRNSMPLAVSMNADLGWPSVGSAGLT